MEVKSGETLKFQAFHCTGKHASPSQASNLTVKNFFMSNSY